MVVRFPSDPFGEAKNEPMNGGGDGDRLAPVTPLRRPASRGVESRHPAGTARGVPRETEHEPGDEGADARIVELPGAARWNNTWADDGGAAATAAAAAVTSVDQDDDEADRQAKKVSAVTIRQLARRGMSRWELEQVLLKREIEPEVFGPELDRLETLGVIDDASLAVSLAFTQHSRKGLGRTAIEQELKRRHIDPELIEIALADIADEDELERATELAVKRIGQLSSYDDETVRRRLHGFLARKGYSSAIVRQAMDAALASRRRGGVRFQ
ncbi:hypothetical protein LLS1_16720 [Leifsonia sp. LS1]|uniref:regulatory protein RecX n=1 Tax=Leifsonia sp. LS1 TaxID=2828483 RepID=UPI001CFE5AB9|nr:regulatory protein RecX [Leifsonia sp. LS1]GIT80003.1 hypothetical protein LLS1_16720 [Leifsonia sp. LS1]